MASQKITPNSWRRGFLTIAVGQAVSLIGSSAVQFSLIWWLASETGSPLMMSLAGLFAFLPQLLLGPFAGVWVDRLKRKVVIIGADLFIGLVATVFALFFWLGVPPYWSACLVLCARSLGSVFHTPAIQSAIPMLVPKEELVSANSWSQLMQSGAFMLGPVLGAAMYAALPMSVILLSDLVGAIIACTTVALIHIPDPVPTYAQMPHFGRELREGVTIFLADGKLCVLTLASALGMTFYLPLSSYYPLMTSSYFNATPWHAGVVELCYAGGMMAGAFAMAKWAGRQNKFVMIHVGFLALGIPPLICGFLPPGMVFFWPFAAMCALMGAGGNVYNIPFVAYLQETVPPEVQGRAFSLLGSLMSASMPLGLLIAGPLAQRYGVPFWFLVSGLAYIIIAAVSALLILRLHRLEG